MLCVCVCMSVCILVQSSYYYYFVFSLVIYVYRVNMFYIFTFSSSLISSSHYHVHLIFISIHTHIYTWYVVRWDVHNSRWYMCGLFIHVYVHQNISIIVARDNPYIGVCNVYVTKKKNIKKKSYQFVAGYAFLSCFRWSFLSNTNIKNGLKP